MHKYSDTKLSPYSPEQLFDLVIDIEKYPQFLPWCRAARILEKHEDYLVAELIISFKHISESYVSKVTFKRPKSQSDEGFINVDIVRGPFSHL
ncbi:MAG: type II toxin-antitoxin system RatA family toxin, partial [Pseudomonadota bacterium]